MKIGICLALISLLLLVAGCGGGGSSSSSANVQPSCMHNYWVSTSGSDTAGDGSASAPFQTLDGARQAVRANPQRGQCAITVNIEAGTYALTAPLQFDAGDSGSMGAPVTYQAAPGNTAPVIISGGIPVALTCANEVCTGTVSGLPSQTLPRQFYVNDQQAIRARSNYDPSINPDEQMNPYYTRVDNGYQPNAIMPSTQATLTHPELVEAVTVTQWKMMRCPVASVSGNTLVMAQPCWNNANTYPVPWNFQLLSWLENAPEFLKDPLTGDYIPDFWYLDPYTRELTWINTGATPPQNAVLPVLQTLIELVGTPGNPVSNIVFKGLQLSYATWLEPNPAGWQGPGATTPSGSANGYVADQSGNILEGSNYTANITGHQPVVYQTPGNVTLSYATHIAFDDDTFTHLGGVALELDTGSQENQVVNNTFTDVSSSAIEIGGFSQEDMRPDSTQETSGNLVANNSISYTGQDYYDSAGIFVGYTTGTVITHNTINHVPWAGIAIGWGWGLFDQGGFPGLDGATFGMWGQYDTPTIMSDNVISNNLFENFLEKLWDGGAIYTNGSQGPDFANGLLIKQNVAMDKRPAAGGNIYYTDGGSQYVTLEQNVSVNNPVGTVNLGLCIPGASSISPGCLATGLISYGADMGGCLPVGHLAYIQNYFADTVTFFGPQLCQNPLIPPSPVDVTFFGNVPVTSLTQVPSSIVQQAGVQSGN